MCAGSESSQKKSNNFGGFVDWNQDVFLEITEGKVCAMEIVTLCEMCIHGEGHHIHWLL
jgi:hypothetical protein